MTKRSPGAIFAERNAPIFAGVVRGYAKKGQVRMYDLEKTGYGFRLTFSGQVTAKETAEWLKESKEALAGQTPGFDVFVDMRTQKPLPEDTHEDMLEGQRLYKSKGMSRSVVIVKSHLLALQLKQFAKETGIYKWERYVDASVDPDWEKIGVDWLEHAIDPDLLVAAGSVTLQPIG